MARRPEKKSESLEIRLPYSQKQAFIEACREKGISASEALRSQIDAFVQEEPAPQKRNFLGAPLAMLERHKKKLIAAVGGTASVLALAFAMPSVADGEMFTSYDRNGDGVLTAGEIAPNDSKILSILDTDHSGTITRDEFKEDGEITNVKDTIKPGDPAKRFIEVELTSFQLDGSEDVKVYVQKGVQEVALDASETDVNNVIEKMKQRVSEVQHIDSLDDLDPETRARMLADMKNNEEFHTMIRLKSLEGVEDAMAQVETELRSLHIDLGDLSNLEELKGLEGLEALKSLGSLEGLEALAELEGLKDLGNMSFDIDVDIDFDPSEIVADLDREIAEIDKKMSVTTDATELEHLKTARAAVVEAREDMKDHKPIKRVFVIRTDADGDIEGEDGEHKKVIIRKESHVEHSITSE